MSLLEASKSTLDTSAEILKVNNESIDFISMLTDDLSLTRASTWKTQKRVRLSIAAYSNR